MSDHEFEKQVRQKLDDLKLTPTANTWVTIEEELRAQKRRRVPVFWLPLLLIGLAAGGYFMFDDKQAAEGRGQKAEVRRQKAEGRGEVGIGKRETADGKQKTAIGKRETGEGKRETRDGKRQTSEGRRQRAEVSDVPFIGARKENVFNANKNDIKSSSEINTSSYKNKLKKSNEAVKASSQEESLKSTGVEKEVTHQNNVAAAPSVSQPSATQDISAIKPSKDSITNQITTTSTTTTTKPFSPEKKKIQKWTFGISGFAGLTAVNDGKLFKEPFVQDVSITPAFAQAPNTPAYTPSIISPGLSYSIGGFAKRHLSKRFSVTAGINYLQMNTRNEVGTQGSGSQVVNSGTRGSQIVTSYYTLELSRPTDYKNRYHFVEIPIILHTRLNKSEKLPFYWNAGVSVSQLIKSNGLHFDGLTGVYYRNNNLLNQTQAAVTTGLSFSILNKTSRPLWIGPSARYNVSKILSKEVVSAKKNFISFGVDMKLFIK